MNKTLIGALTLLSSLSFATVAEASSLVKSFTSTLDKDQEVSFSDSTATGTAILNLLQDDVTGAYSLEYKLTVTENGDLDFTALRDLPGTAVSEGIAVTKFHLHGGAPRDSNGVLPFNIREFNPTDGQIISNIDGDLMIDIMGGGVTMLSGLLTADEFASSSTYSSFVDVVDELLATPIGQDTSFYWNIHTVEFPGGAIRGQVEPVPEPLTILGAGAAISFGAGFKRKLAKKK